MLDRKTDWLMEAVWICWIGSVYEVWILENDDLRAKYGNRWSISGLREAENPSRSEAEDKFRPLRFPIVSLNTSAQGFLWIYIFCRHCGVSDTVDLRKDQICLPLDVQELWKPVWFGRPLAGTQCSPLFTIHFPFCSFHRCLFTTYYMATIYEKICGCWGISKTTNILFHFNSFFQMKKL